MALIGIDLGTSNSLIAYWTEGGPKLIPNALGSFLTPSVVSVDDNGEIIVGPIAKERLITHPGLTAAAFKRFMGTEKQFHLRNYTFSATELSSFVLRSLKADAEAFLGEEVTEAVISVPAYFNDEQRKATKYAAEIAGFKVERLISEPTAAALSYGLHEKKDNTQFLIFDLGGGTFDVSVLEFFEGIMEVKSVAGDNFLGGEDFTELLASYFVEKSGIAFENLDSKAKSIIFNLAENCKRDLGVGTMGMMRYETPEQLYEVTINYSQFEKLVSPLILRLKNPIERALNDVSLSPKDLDTVILIGGATRMQLIKSVVGKMFGHFPFSNINPDEAVALGAAVQAALKNRDQALKEMILTDVCPYTLGIEVSKNSGESNRYENGYFSPIIERNNPIPISRVERYCTLVDNQLALNLRVYQGESMRVANNLLLGELEIAVPPMKKGEASVDVRFTYDINGILEVDATSVSSGETKTLVIEKSTEKMSPEALAARLNALKDIKIHPRDRSENRLLLAKAERLYEESIGAKRDIIMSQLVQFDGILAEQDLRKIARSAKEFKEFLDDIEQSRSY
ncbi:molecular chaperone HscC [Paenibacillus sp. GSMTC-2017]|uniref:molecular chaperone HscC n=1 Tax=Paenibacillus sp. GSMTC-2017 TaxID=2794350 RepID=UPI0018D6A0A9|nr:molecular chaperone HscC [Paenibacillus sp. GSMTC-2017]MBH5320898.1 molecular chaperone HscC [Paenibacillus sp. GSMTC-2017]